MSLNWYRTYLYSYRNTIRSLWREHSDLLLGAAAGPGALSVLEGLARSCSCANEWNARGPLLDGERTPTLALALLLLLSRRALSSDPAAPTSRVHSRPLLDTTKFYGEIHVLILLMINIIFCVDGSNMYNIVISYEFYILTLMNYFQSICIYYYKI